MATSTSGTFSEELCTPSAKHLSVEPLNSSCRSVCAVFYVCKYDFGYLCIFHVLQNMNLL